MTPRIGGGGPQLPKGPESVSNKTSEQATPQKAAQGGAKAQKSVVDRFERAGPVLAQRLEAMAGKKALGKTQFTSAHLAQLASAFASQLKKNPNASRKERAKMFARAILKKTKFGKIFDEADEEDLEKAYEAIAQQLEGSPVLAQLVEEVTEGTRKFEWE
ncbi:hypothetical protein KAI87_04710 [Myxococcota bacterium]|nr:hypothetical protein [Myxococcota bacterium]